MGNTDTLLVTVQKTPLRPVIPYCSVMKAADGKVLTAPEGFKKYWGERKISYKHLGTIQN